MSNGGSVNLIPFRISGRGYQLVPPVRPPVCLLALSRINCLTYRPKICQARATHITIGLRPRVIWVALACGLGWYELLSPDKSHVTHPIVWQLIMFMLSLRVLTICNTYLVNYFLADTLETTCNMNKWLKNINKIYATESASEWTSESAKRWIET